MITFTSLQYLNGSSVVEGTGQTIFTLSVDIQPSSWSQDLTFATSLISYLLLTRKFRTKEKYTNLKVGAVRDDLKLPNTAIRHVISYHPELLPFNVCLLFSNIKLQSRKFHIL